MKHLPGIHLHLPSLPSRAAVLVVAALGYRVVVGLGAVAAAPFQRRMQGLSAPVDRCQLSRLSPQSFFVFPLTREQVP